MRCDGKLKSTTWFTVSFTCFSFPMFFLARHTHPNWEWHSHKHSSQVALLKKWDSIDLVANPTDWQLHSMPVSCGCEERCGENIVCRLFFHWKIDRFVWRAIGVEWRTSSWNRGNQWWITIEHWNWHLTDNSNVSIIHSYSENSTNETSLEWGLLQNSLLNPMKFYGSVSFVQSESIFLWYIEQIRLSVGRVIKAKWRYKGHMVIKYAPDIVDTN